MDAARGFGVLLLLCLALMPASLQQARASDDEPQYRDEMEQRLESADSELLDLQMARFRAMFAENQDEAEIERIDKDFRELQKKRRELLRATGRVP